MDQQLPNTLTGHYQSGDPIYDLGSIVTQYGHNSGTGLSITYKTVPNLQNENIKQIDELVAVGNALEEIKQKLRQASQGEALSPSGVMAINLIVEKMLARVGISAQCKISLENYCTNSSKREAINIAIEGFSDGVRAVAFAIGRLLKKIFTFIYEDIENAARGATATARRAVRIQDAAQKLLVRKSDSPKSFVTRGSLLSCFNENGTAMKYETIKSEYVALLDVFNIRYSQRMLSGAIATLGNSISANMSSEKILGFDVDEAKVASDRALQYLKRNGFNGFKISSGSNEHVEILENTLPFGNAIFTAIFSKEGDKLTGFGSKIVNEEVSAPKQLPALELHQVIELAKEVETQMNKGIYRDYKKIKSEVNKLGNIVGHQCDDIIKHQRTAENGTIPSLNFLKKVSEGVKELVTNLYGYGGYSNRCVLLYCEYSLKQWK